MDSLRAIFASKLAFVENKAAQGDDPSPSELGGFMRELTQQAGASIRVAPAQLQQQLKSSFAEIGWDVRANRSTREAPPGLPELSAFLSRCIAAVEGFTPSLEPTAAELEDISEACDRLFGLDLNRLTPGREYEIDLQEGKKPYQQGDYAPDPLFKHVSEEVFRRPTFAAFVELLNNYESRVGQREDMTTLELQENSKFLDACLKTPCMQYAHKYLVAKGKAPASVGGFKAMLSEAWFEMYSRDHGSLDSSGFEHCFVGESKLGKISGLHNWMQLYLEEKRGHLDYRGYIRARGQRSDAAAPPSENQLITVQFEWNGELKDVSSSFVGVSPEFELSLYSLLFFLGHEKTTVRLGPYLAEITTYSYRQRDKLYIGSAFPGEAPLDASAAATRIQAVQRGRQARGN